MLLLCIPIAVALTYKAHLDRQRALPERQRQMALAALSFMCSKGVDAHFANGSKPLEHATFFFKNANVSDSDLIAFIPA